MSKGTLFNGRDFWRIARLIAVDGDTDFGFLAGAVLFLMAKLIHYDKHRFPDDFFSLHPDPVQRGTRMLLSDERLYEWRKKYFKEMEVLRQISKDYDFDSMLNYLTDNIDTISSIL